MIFVIGIIVALFSTVAFKNHSYFFPLQNTHRDKFPYERHPESKAYIPFGEGDYYYTAAVWGGYMEEMYKLVR